MFPASESAAAAAVSAEETFVLRDFIAVATDKLVHFSIRLAVAIAVFYIGRFIVRRLIGLIRRILARRRVDASIASFTQSAVETVLYFFVIITVIGILGIETSSFIALFASAGVAIGMALSGTLQNFAGGVLILSLRPYNVGDYIETQGYSGTVKAIQMFHTIITTPDNKTIIIPNGPLSNGTINNYSRQPDRRLDWIVSVAYGTDFNRAKEVIYDILARVPEIIHNNPAQPVDVFLDALADSSVNIKVRAWVASADYWTVFYRVNEEIYATLPLHGIEFPFPQMDVHLTSTPAPDGSK